MGVVKKPVVLNPCKCGCGTLVKENYKQGHGRRGKKNTATHNMKIGLANKEHILTDAERARLRQMSLRRRGCSVPLIVRQRISRTAKERGVGKWMVGRHPSASTLEKLRNQKRLPHTDSTKAKISVANRGSGNGMHGRTHTPEAKRVISVASKRTWSDPNCKNRVRCRSDAGKAHFRAMGLKAIMPLKDTTIERIVQGFLRDYAVEFIPHYVVEDIPHAYRCDMYVPIWNLVIECDGIYWHKYPRGRGIDHLRTTEMWNAGYRILRLWEHEIRAMDARAFYTRLFAVFQTTTREICYGT